MLSVFKREVTYIKARAEGFGDVVGTTSGHGGQLDKHSVEQALRRQFDEEASLVFVPGEEWAGSINDQSGEREEEARVDKKGASSERKNGKDADAGSVRGADRVGKDMGKDQGIKLDPHNDLANEGEFDEDADYVRDHSLDSGEKSVIDVDYAGGTIDEYDAAGDGVDDTEDQMGSLDEEEDGDQADEDYGAYEDAGTQPLFDGQDAKSQLANPNGDLSGSPEVQQAMKELKACKTLECIGKAHKKLAGKTKFNAPHYFLIGFQKCATTSVNNYLRGHPEYMPSVLKEAHYFTACAKSWNDTNCKANSTQDYIDNYLRISDAVDNGLMAATVDASVDYAWKGEDLAREIYNVFPWLKIVVMMREPISRVISYTRMWTQKGVRTSTHKDNRIACDVGEDLFDCLYPHLTPTAYTGHYATPLEGWLKVWPADQIHVIQFEEFVSETDAVMRRLKKFLGLDPTLPENQQLYNVNTRKDSGGSPMKRREYRTLIEMARPDSERVADLLQKHGLAEKDAWMRRWEKVWEDNLSACGPDRICMINSN